MRSQAWSVPACRAFLALATLPLYASAQLDAFNSATPATTPATTSTSALVPVDTIIDNPVDTPVDTPVVDSTTQPAVVISETTTAIFIPDTPVDTPVEESTTASAVVVPETTTSIFIPDTPVDTPVVESTTESVVIPETTTSIFIPDNETTPGESVQDTSTDLPIDITTTPGQPIDVTTTTSELPVDVTTTPEAPADTTTTAEQPADTTTEQPADTTTTQDAATITDAPVLTTVTGAAATSSVSSVSTEILGLIPIINSWKDDPDALKDETKNTVDNVINDVTGVIKDLGGDPKKGCDGKRKRGLLGAIGDIVNSLVCIASDLTDISGDIVIGDVTAVTSIISGVQSQAEDLTDENDDENNSSEEQASTTEEPTSTTSSPCTDDTANHVTIICKPTQVTEDGNVVTTETCYSSITAEITGCSVTEETTVISTTGTAAAITPCASDTCGGVADACPMNELPLSGADMNYVSTSVDCAAISTITTSELPTGYGTLNGISVAEPTPYSGSDGSTAAKRNVSPRAFGDNTSPDPLYVANLSPVWVSQLGDASGHWFNYPETGQGFVGVNGIYGCTAVIIASEKGVYLSHIWENPVFIDGDWAPTSDESFNSKAFEALRDGTQYAQSVTALIGDEANPGVLNAIYAPKVFVLTPFTTANDPTGITTRLRYQDRAQKLANDLAGVIPGSGGSGYLLGYTRTNQELSTMEPGWLGRAIFEVDVLQSVLVTPHAPDGSLRIGRWRLWVEDQLITYQDFWIPDYAPGNQKRQDSGADACLVQGTGTTAEVTSTAADSATPGPGTSDPATSNPGTSDPGTIGPSTPGPESAETTTPGIESAETTTTQPTETTGESIIGTTPGPATETPVEPTTETSTEAAETTTNAINTPTTLLTSILTTTPAPDTTTSNEETSTAGNTYTGPYYCVNFGGPSVPTPYCQCSTTTAGQTFFASAPLISLHCTDYTSYPADITLQPTDLVTEAPEPTPWVTTENNGAIISYPDQTVEVGAVGTIKYTYTVGEGTPVTIRPPDATQTDSNNKGSSQCHSIDDACDRAVAEFEDDVIYTEFASYYTRIKSGIIVAFTFGQAGCVVEFDCDDWSQGGMNGEQIKDAFQYMKDNDGVTKCGSTYLSNTCHVTSNYCTNCNERHQDIN